LQSKNAHSGATADQAMVILDTAIDKARISRCLGWRVDGDYTTIRESPAQV